MSAKQTRATAVLRLRTLITDIERVLDQGNLPLPEHLANSVNDYAMTFGALRLEAAVEGLDDQQQKDKATNMLLNGPDDGWSGRTNDVRRAQHDGLVRRASEIIRGY
jgi:hypothetical protein